MKRKIAWILTLCMLLTLALPFSAFAAPAADDVWEIVKSGQTEGTGYKKFADAKAALEDGDTLRLLGNISLSSAISTDKNITFDGNGKTITYTYTKTAADTTVLITLSGTGTVVVRNLTVVLGDTASQDPKMTALKFTGANANATVENCNLTANRMVIWASGASSKITVKSGTYVSEGKGSVVQLQDNQQGLELTIDGGDFVQKGSQYILRTNKFKSVTVNNGNFTQLGYNLPIIYAMELAGGTIDIKGGNFKTIGKEASGDRASLMETVPHKITISGGFFELNDNKSAFMFKEIEGAEKGSLTITGGIFVHNGMGKFLDASKSLFDISITGGSFHGTAVADVLATGAASVAGKDIAMRDGAGVRLIAGDDDGSGIRFTTDISAEAVAYAKAMTDDQSSITYGTVIVPTKNVSGHANFSISSLEAKGVKYENIVANVGMTGSDAEGYTIRCALVKIKQENYEMKLSARAYVSYTVNGQRVYVYSDYVVTNNSRSIAQVAESALSDVQSTATVKGVLDYNNKVMQNGVEVYSPYTDEQIAILRAYLSETALAGEQIISVIPKN